MKTLPALLKLRRNMEVGKKNRQQAARMRLTVREEHILTTVRAMLLKFIPNVLPCFPASIVR